MSLIDYIPNAKKYTGYQKACKAEENPHMWVDSLSNEHIEIHSTTLNGEVFRDELTKFINNNWEEIRLEMFNEIITTNGKKFKVPYVVLNLKEAVPYMDGGVSC